MLNRHEEADWREATTITHRSMLIAALVCTTIVLTVSACSTTPEQQKEAEKKEQLREQMYRENINKNLPPGCEFKALGPYYSTPIYAVFCKDTVTTSWIRHVGKGYYPASVTVERGYGFE